MVKYYGRARQRIGSVNTNQIGLKMSGCVSKVGRKGVIDRYISRRSQCNQKYCGPVMYHDVYWSWNNQRCVPRVPRGQSFNSGVGHKSIPRFNCGDTCAVDLDPDTAVGILKAYFDNDNQNVALASSYADCIKAGASLCLHNSSGFKTIVPGTDIYQNLPVHVQNAVNVVNDIGFTAPLTAGGTPVLHVVTVLSKKNQLTLSAANYGSLLKFGINSLISYGYSIYNCVCRNKCNCTGAGAGILPLYQYCPQTCWTNGFYNTGGCDDYCKKPLNDDEISTQGYSMRGCCGKFTDVEITSTVTASFRACMIAGDPTGDPFMCIYTVKNPPSNQLLAAGTSTANGCPCTGDNNYCNYNTKPGRGPLFEGTCQHPVNGNFPICNCNSCPTDGAPCYSPAPKHKECDTGVDSSPNVNLTCWQTVGADDSTCPGDKFPMSVGSSNDTDPGYGALQPAASVGTGLPKSLPFGDPADPTSFISKLVSRKFALENPNKDVVYFNPWNINWKEMMKMVVKDAATMEYYPDVTAVTAPAGAQKYAYIQLVYPTRGWGGAQAPDVSKWKLYFYKKITGAGQSTNSGCPVWQFTDV